MSFGLLLADRTYLWDPVVEHGAYGAIPHTHLVESQHLATLARRLPFARRARYSRNPKNDAFVCVRSWWSVKKRRESSPGYATFPVDPLNCRQSFMPACMYVLLPCTTFAPVLLERLASQDRSR